ncbi:MAG: mannitol dehydrogenase [Robiginitomaculum sp.]|nr:MAG: mannitol dehydrogenase [Robiginitomaculum sp.]
MKPRLGSRLNTPAYDRSQAVGVVHLGTGAFHRAHQAVYFDTLMAQGETGWMIQGASLRSDAIAKQLNPQGGLYTMVVQDGSGETDQIISSIKNVLVAPQQPAALLSALAHADTQLVTLTVTEKGYHLDPASGALNLDDPLIRADLSGQSAPRTAPGFLVSALKARRDKGLTPFTILSCDNLPHNGVLTCSAICEFARQSDPALADWIEKEAAFPSSMVDRIVPATTDADLKALATRLPYRDEGMVKTEPFTQWVVEDNFCGRRPALETAGVTMTKTVADWEHAKLRLLNGAHSALAYLGSLAGHEYVDQAMGAPGFERFVDMLWDEAVTTLKPFAGFDADAYRGELKDRFCNPSLKHRTFQIAMDGSQKLPQRLLGAIRDRRAQGLTSPALSLGVGAWMRWQYAQDEHGQSFVVDDPLAHMTQEAVRSADGNPVQTAKALVNIEDIFATDFKDDVHSTTAFSDALSALLNAGAAQTVQSFAETGSYS